ncbi:hypothetical protein JB92DRAFT_3097612 [Gautieria morchelliformis]|nr:hypothetical protein JB92DRAFT_3097612 [Gautieria morchelliformis]
MAGWRRQRRSVPVPSLRFPQTPIIKLPWLPALQSTAPGDPPNGLTTDGCRSTAFYGKRNPPATRNAWIADTTPSVRGHLLYSRAGRGATPETFHTIIQFPLLVWYVVRAPCMVTAARNIATLSPAHTSPNGSHAHGQRDEGDTWVRNGSVPLEQHERTHIRPHSSPGQA